MTEQTYTFRAHAGARQSGKRTAHDAWAAYAAREEAFSGCRPRRASAGCDDRWIDGGIIADPIDVTALDVETAAREDLDALAAGRWLPGVTTETIIDTFGRRVVRVSSAPCITTVGA